MIEYISQTMINQFIRCQVQWCYRWEEGIIIPPGIAAHIGTGFHMCSDVNFKAKLVTGVDEPLSVIQDAARDGYVQALHKTGVYFPPDEIASAKIQMADGIDTVVSLAKKYRDKFSPAINPALIEKVIYLEHQGLSVPFRGTIDIYTKDKTWIDLKTANKKWGQNRADTSIQATLYRELVKAETGEYPKDMAFAVFVKKSKEDPQILRTSREQGDFDVLVRRVQIMMKCIESGNYLPADPESWSCNVRFCGFWWMCKHIPEHKKLRKGV